MHSFNLFKADLRRLFKRKSFFIVLGILLAYTLLMFGVMRGALALMSSDLVGMAESGDTIFTDTMKSLYAQLAFGSSLGASGLGLCIALVVGLYVGSDFSQNTIRNKIIAGNSRVKIYLSSLLNNVVLGMIYYFAVTVFSTVLLLMMFGTSELGVCLIRAAAGIVPYLGIIAIITFICISVKNQALGIVVGILIMYLLPSIVSVLDMITLTGALSKTGEKVIEVLGIINPISLIDKVVGVNIYSMMSMMSMESTSGLTSALSNETLAQSFYVPLSWAAVLTGLGILKFHFTDIK